ncbi:MAG: methyltransferase domain-containing protein [Sedimentisphaerales bacterium]|nr:methyltransferase domain-containing protein [Sedimentisphaerales bacterium]
MEAKQNKPQWQYDEMKLCGVKFDTEEFADKYDKHHQKFRDYKKEAQQRIELLGLDKQSAVIDIGCGTGAFAINAASYYKKIYAVDVAELMINHARRKAKAAGIDNIEFHHGGFLTYEHKDKPVDGIVCTLVLHHLPDFWKQVALTRLAQMLKPGGRLLLFDVVLSFDIENYESYIEGYIKTMVERLGTEMKQELETHFRQEYSTFDWVMEELLKKAGFEINTVDYREGFFANYLCTKKDE